MQFLSWTFIRGRLRAIVSMMKDKTVPKRKKALVIFGLIYLVLPVDLIPPILGPVGFIDDAILWIWIIWHLKDTLDQYWLGEKEVDLSKDFHDKNIIEDVDYTVEDHHTGQNRNENIKDELCLFCRVFS